MGSPEAIQPPMTMPTRPRSSAVTAPNAALRVTLGVSSFHCLTLRLYSASGRRSIPRRWQPPGGDRVERMARWERAAQLGVPPRPACHSPSRLSRVRPLAATPAQPPVRRSSCTAWPAPNVEFPRSCRPPSLPQQARRTSQRLLEV